MNSGRSTSRGSQRPSASTPATAAADAAAWIQKDRPRAAGTAGTITVKRNAAGPVASNFQRVAMIASATIGKKPSAASNTPPSPPQIHMGTEIPTTASHTTDAHATTDFATVQRHSLWLAASAEAALVPATIQIGIAPTEPPACAERSA